MNIPAHGDGVVDERKPTEDEYNQSMLNMSALFLRVLLRYPTKNVTVADFGSDPTTRSVLYDHRFRSGLDTIASVDRKQDMTYINLLFGSTLVAHAKKYSAYSSTARMAEILKGPLRRGCRFVLLPLGLIDVRRGGHANIIVMQRIDSTADGPYYAIERWDPHTSGSTIPESIDKHLSSFFAEVLNNMGYRCVYLDQTTTCPLMGGNFQTIVERSCQQLKTIQKDGFCVLWTLMFMMMRVHEPNQNLSSKQVTQHLTEWARNKPKEFCEYAFDFLRQVYALSVSATKRNDDHRTAVKELATPTDSDRWVPAYEFTSKGKRRKPCAPNQYRNPVTGRCKKKKL